MQVVEGKDALVHPFPVPCDATLDCAAGRSGFQDKGLDLVHLEGQGIAGFPARRLSGKEKKKR